MLGGPGAHLTKDRSPTARSVPKAQLANVWRGSQAAVVTRRACNAKAKVCGLSGPSTPGKHRLGHEGGGDSLDPGLSARAGPACRCARCAGGNCAVPGRRRAGQPHTRRRGRAPRRRSRPRGLLQRRALRRRGPVRVAALSDRCCRRQRATSRQARRRPGRAARWWRSHCRRGSVRRPPAQQPRAQRARLAVGWPPAAGPSVMRPWPNPHPGHPACTDRCRARRRVAKSVHAASSSDGHIARRVVQGPVPRASGMQCLLPGPGASLQSPHADTWT